MGTRREYTREVKDLFFSYFGRLSVLNFVVDTRTSNIRSVVTD